MLPSSKRCDTCGTWFEDDGNEGGGSEHYSSTLKPSTRNFAAGNLIPVAANLISAASVSPCWSRKKKNSVNLSSPTLHYHSANNNNNNNSNKDALKIAALSSRRISFIIKPCCFLSWIKRKYNNNHSRSSTLSDTNTDISVDDFLLNYYYPSSRSRLTSSRNFNSFQYVNLLSLSTKRFLLVSWSYLFTVPLTMFTFLEKHQIYHRVALGGSPRMYKSFFVVSNCVFCY